MAAVEGRIRCRAEKTTVTAAPEHRMLDAAMVEGAAPGGRDRATARLRRLRLPSSSRSDDPLTAHPLHLRFPVAEVGEDLVRVLAEERCTPSDAGAGHAEPHRMARHRGW